MGDPLLATLSSVMSDNLGDTEEPEHSYLVSNSLESPNDRREADSPECTAALLTHAPVNASEEHSEHSDRTKEEAQQALAAIAAMHRDMAQEFSQVNLALRQMRQRVEVAESEAGRALSLLAAERRERASTEVKLASVRDRLVETERQIAAGQNEPAVVRRELSIATAHTFQLAQELDDAVGELQTVRDQMNRKRQRSRHAAGRRIRLRKKLGKHWRGLRPFGDEEVRRDRDQSPE